MRLHRRIAIKGDDRRPGRFGELKTYSCNHNDDDGDGVLNSVDLCPKEKGVVAFQGCLNDPATTPVDDLSTLSLIVSDYGKIFSGNPVGENEEIADALMGANPKRLAFLPQQGPFLDSAGRLIDRWGTPYFFHALSGSKMEIISAGPDLRHHTADDVTSD